MVDLALDVQHFQAAALSASTFETYATALRSYQLFCSQTHLQDFPLLESTLQYYSSSMARRLAYRTMKVYLSGLQYHSVMRGFRESISGMAQLHYLLHGIRRVQGPSFSRPRRQPLTIAHLRTIHYRFHFMRYSEFQRIMFQAAKSLAFSGFLCCSEYTCASRFDPTLLVRDVVIACDRTIMHVTIRASKTDPFRVGTVGVTLDDICPVACMHNYISSHPAPAGPLFILTPQMFVTQNDKVALLMHCLPDVTNINTHSFRIGGASAASSAGIPDNTIQILGRWTSDAYKRYLHNLILQLLACHVGSILWILSLGYRQVTLASKRGLPGINSQQAIFGII